MDKQKQFTQFFTTKNQKNIKMEPSAIHTFLWQGLFGISWFAGIRTIPLCMYLIKNNKQKNLKAYLRNDARLALSLGYLNGLNFGLTRFFENMINPWAHYLNGFLTGVTTALMLTIQGGITDALSQRSILKNNSNPGYVLGRAATKIRATITQQNYKFPKILINSGLGLSLFFGLYPSVLGKLRRDDVSFYYRMWLCFGSMLIVDILREQIKNQIFSIERTTPGFKFSWSEYSLKQIRNVFSLATFFNTFSMFIYQEYLTKPQHHLS